MHADCYTCIEVLVALPSFMTDLNCRESETDVPLHLLNAGEYSNILDVWNVVNNVLPDQ
jgi:hypothetical protein